MDLSIEKSNVNKSNNIENISINGKQSERKYVCNYAGCNLAYFKQSRLDRHIRLHTGERPYKCNYPECTKAYTNSSHLKRHAETHNPTQQKYQCSKCLLMLSNRHNLKRHYARIHGNAFKCNECDQEFGGKQALIKHIATHFNVTPYKCSQCDEILMNMKNLKRHEKLHKKAKMKKSYPCPIAQCTEVFDKWTLLLKHKKTQHFSDFKCDQCEKTFSNRKCLKSHLRNHQNILIACPYNNCDRSYFFKSNLTSHINCYHLNKKFTCDICKAELTAKSKLKQHIQNHESKKEKKVVKQPRKKRKDAGIPRTSMVAVLSGLLFDQKRDVALLKRKTNIEFINTEDSCTILNQDEW